MSFLLPLLPQSFMSLFGAQAAGIAVRKRLDRLVMKHEIAWG